MNSSMALSHNPDLCNNCDCLVTFYNDIVLAVAVADGDDTLPRKKNTDFQNLISLWTKQRE